MKNFLKIIYSFFILIVGLISCDKTQQQNCLEYRTDKLIGTYGVSESCTNSNNNPVTFLSINPSNSVNINEVIIYNFNNSGLNVIGQIGCVDSTATSYQIYFRIPQQSLGSNSNTVVGEGYYRELNGYHYLNFDVQLNENGQANYCTYNCTKY